MSEVRMRRADWPAGLFEVVTPTPGELATLLRHGWLVVEEATR